MARTAHGAAGMVLVVTGLLPLAVAGQGAAVDFTQVTRPVVQITDTSTIQFLLFELIIEPLEHPTMLQVIDVTQNGFGPDDVLVIYPSLETFLIPEFLPDSVQQVMSQWTPEVEFRLDSGNLPPDVLAALIGSGPDTTRRAENAILYDVVQAVERNYRDLPVGILFQRDSVGFTFQMWDYRQAAMAYTPRPAFATDSTVSSVLDLLQDVGYLPGQGPTGLQSGVNRATGGVGSVERALAGIRSSPNEGARQLATKTVLLGSFDLDRSGTIDAPREIDALPCPVWLALQTTFPGFLERFGFVEGQGPYLGSMVFSISERVRQPAARRAAACLQGREPPPTEATEMAPVVSRTELPQPVSELLAHEMGAEILETVAGEPGSATWAAGVRSVLVRRFDGDHSGLLDQAAEVAAIPCAAWLAIRATHERVVVDLAFDDPLRYVGDRIGIAPNQRAPALARIRACAAGSEPLVPQRARAASPAPQGPARAAGGFSPERPLAGIRDIPAEAERQLATRTILRGAYDVDRSGAIDTPAELDAISCAVWDALELAFPGFAEQYGFMEGASADAYRGSIIFNISTRLQAPAARRIAACRRGEDPAPTAADQVAAPNVILIPASLRAYLTTRTAAEIVLATTAVEPGSAVWAAAVRGVLVDRYDLDGSGWLDAEGEIDAVPCIVWTTIEATYGAPLSRLGFGGSGPYLGDRIGVVVALRLPVWRRLTACGG